MVDASVAIKWVIDEVGSAAAIAIRRHELVAPDLIFSECCNALWKAARRGELSTDKALARMEDLVAVPLNIVPARSMSRRVLELAIDLNHPTYDILYLALAEMYDARVVTADTRLLNKVAASRHAHLAISLEHAAAN